MLRTVPHKSESIFCFTCKPQVPAEVEAPTPVSEEKGIQARLLSLSQNVEDSTWVELGQEQALPFAVSGLA